MSWRATALLLLLGLVGCTGSRQRIEARLNGEGDSAQLPVLEPPMAAGEIEAMAAGFAWTDSRALPELDEDGHPALRYATVLLRDRENLNELMSLGLYCDALPLFDSELSRWDGQTGIFEFPGSSAGDVAFCMLPAQVYNLFRQLALDGDPLLDAIVLRELPEPDARLPGGSLSYTWAAAQGFRYGLDVDAPSATGPTDGGVGAGTGMLFGRIRRSVRRIVRDVVNGTRRALAAAREALGGSHEFSLTLFVHPTDQAFDTSDLMRQHWGSHGGEPVRVDGLPVQVASGVMVSLDEKKTDDQGFVRMRIPRARRIRVFLRMQNRAADMIGLVWEKRILVFHGHVDRNAGVHIDADLRSGDMNILAQLTDARHFTRDVLHYRSPHTLRTRLPARSRSMPAPLVRTGAFAGVLFPNAITPCLGSFGFGSISLGSGRGYSVLANVLSILDEADMYFPKDLSRSSRLVPTHEYGHFVMCSMLSDQGRRAFGRAWGEVIGDSLGGDGPTNGQAGILAEAWADFFASQVAGGTDYFGLNGGFGTPSGQSYCNLRLVLGGNPCMDDNVGAPFNPVAFPRGQVTRPVNIGSGSPRDQAIARWATLLTDAVDGSLGSTDAFGNGVSWRRAAAPGPGGPVPLPRYAFGQSANDEAVALPGEGLAETLGDWAFTSRHLHFAPFANSLARTMLLEGATPTEVCDLFALHSPTLSCAALIDPSTVAAGVAPSTPRSLAVTTSLASPAAMPEASLSWSDVSPLATDFESRCQAPPHDELHHPAYARSQTDGFRSLPFDRELQFSVATRIDGRSGVAAEVRTQSPAEPVGVVTGEALSGAARLSWAAVDASAYLVRQLAPTVTELGMTTDPSAEVHGLAGDADYRFEVVSLNAAGERCPFPSPALLLHTLPSAILHVSARLGDDADAFGGTPSRPFASVARALRAAPAGMLTTLRVAAGDYAEPSLRVTGQDLVIEGGYAEDASVWTPEAGTTTIRPMLSASASAPLSSGRFDASAGGSRALLAALEIEGASHVTLRDVSLSSGEDPGSSCRAVIHVNDADLRLERSGIQGEGGGHCSIGIQANASETGHRLEVLDSELSGLSTSGSFAADLMATALASAGLDEVHVVDSNLVGLRANVGGGVANSSGWVDDGSGSIRVSRSTLAATRLTSGRLGAGLSAGADLAVGRQLFFDNTVVDAPGSDDESDGLRVEGLAATGINVQLVQITARVGQLFLPTGLPSTRGLRAAAVAISGRVRRMVVVNDIFAFADWGSFTQYGAGLDLSGLSPEVAQVDSQLTNNVWSYPPATAFGQAGGPLVMCDWAGEFSAAITTESGLDDGASYTCRTHGLARASGNLALTDLPGATPPRDRFAPVLTEDGQPLSGPSGTSADTLLLLQTMAAPLAAPLPVEDIRLDRDGTPRDVTAPGVGAWVIP